MAYSSAKQITIVISAIDRTANVFNRMTGRISTLEQAARRAYSIFATLMSAMGAATVGVGLAFNAMRERAVITFSTLSKSAATGKQFVKELFDFVRSTPLEFDASVKSAQELYSRGFALKDIIPIMKVLGDTAAAIPGNSADTLDRLALAIGQIQAKGKVSAEEMTRQLGQVIPAWRYVAEAMDITIAEAMDKAKKGELDVGEVLQALFDGMKRDFGGTMEAVSQSVSGLETQIKRTFQELAGEFTAPLFDRLRGALQSVKKEMSDGSLQASVRRFGQDFDQTIGAIAGGINATLIPAIRFIGSDSRRAAVAVGILAAAFAFLNPGGAIFIGIMAIVGAIGLARTKNSELSDDMLLLKVRILQARDAFKTWTKPIADAVGWVKGAISLLGSLSNDAQKSANGSAPGGASKILGFDLGPISDLKNWVDKKVGVAQDSVTSRLPGGSNFQISNDTALALGDLSYRQYSQSAQGLEEMWMSGSNISGLLNDATGDMDQFSSGVLDLSDAFDDAGGAADDASKKADEFADKLKTALSDGVIDLTESLDLGLTPAAAAGYEYTDNLTKALLRQSEAQYELEKATVKFMLAAQDGGNAVVIIADQMAQAALDLQNQAAQALYGRPTREEAMLQYQIAQLDYNIATYSVAGAGRDAMRATRLADLEGQLDRLKENHESQLDEIERQKKAINYKDPAKGEITDALNDKQFAMRDQFDAEEKALQKQIDDLRNFKDPILKQMEDERGLLQNKLVMMQAENALQQAGLLLDDQTLINEREQNAMWQELSNTITDLSGIVVQTRDRLGDSLIPSFDAAMSSAYNLANAMNAAAVSVGNYTSPGSAGPAMTTQQPGPNGLAQDPGSIDVTYRNMG